MEGILIVLLAGTWLWGMLWYKECERLTEVVNRMIKEKQGEEK